MNKNRLIFYGIFGTFHLLSFVFTLIMDQYSGDTSFLFKMLKWIPWFKYITLLGLILITIDVVWSWIINRDTIKQKEALTSELDTLKARLFDLQEAAKESSEAHSRTKA